MKQQTLTVSTRGRGFVDVTNEVRAVVRASGVTTGVCTLFIQHTSASLVIQENADPSVLRDLGAWFERIAPRRRGSTSTPTRGRTTCRGTFDPRSRERASRSR